MYNLKCTLGTDFTTHCRITQTCILKVDRLLYISKTIQIVECQNKKKQHANICQYVLFTCFLGYSNRYMVKSRHDGMFSATKPSVIAKHQSFHNLAAFFKVQMSNSKLSFLDSPFTSIFNSPQVEKCCKKGRDANLFHSISLYRP